MQREGPAPKGLMNPLSTMFAPRLLLLALSLLSSGSGLASESAPALSADQVLERLLAGNKRFVAGRSEHPHQTAARRVDLAKGQAPIAIVLTCSDSRVAPELYFDQGLGDIFVIRNAGNVTDDHVIGSIEYAVEHLHAPLIIVVGHEKCGAVAAAVTGGHAPGHIASIVESINPAVAAAKDLPGDKVDQVVRTNARHSAGSLSQSDPFILPAVRAGKVKVVAARYSLATGEIEILR